MRKKDNTAVSKIKKARKKRKMLICLTKPSNSLTNKAKRKMQDLLKL